MFYSFAFIVSFLVKRMQIRRYRLTRLTLRLPVSSCTFTTTSLLLQWERFCGRVLEYAYMRKINVRFGASKLETAFIFMYGNLCMYCKLTNFSTYCGFYWDRSLFVDHREPCRCSSASYGLRSGWRHQAGVH